MIGAPILLLLGIVGSLESEDVPVQLALAAAPAPAATNQPQVTRNDERRLRLLKRRAKRNDITEMLKAMNLMRIGIAPSQEQAPTQNR